MLSRVFCAVAVVATLSLWSVAQAADEPTGKSAENAAEKAAGGHGAADAHQDGGGDAAHGDGHGEHIGHKGVTEDVSSFSPSLATYTVIVFLGLFGLLYKFAWGPISEGLDKRESGIRQSIADAENAREQAASMLADHEAKLAGVQEEVKEILAEARRDAEHTKNEIMAAAQSEAEATRDRALGDIERARDQALKDLFDQVSTQVAAATEHVLGRSLDAADQQRLIAEALADVTAGVD